VAQSKAWIIHRSENQKPQTFYPPCQAVGSVTTPCCPPCLSLLKLHPLSPSDSYFFKHQLIINHLFISRSTASSRPHPILLLFVGSIGRTASTVLYNSWGWIVRGESTPGKFLSKAYPHSLGIFITNLRSSAAEVSPSIPHLDLPLVESTSPSFTSLACNPVQPNLQIYFITSFRCSENGRYVLMAPPHIPARAVPQPEMIARELDTIGSLNFKHISLQKVNMNANSRLRVDRNPFEYALSSNAAWAGYKNHQNPSFFPKQTKGQTPSIRTSPSSIS